MPATESHLVSHDFYHRMRDLLAEIAAGMKKQVEESKPLLEKPGPRLYYPYGIKGEAPRVDGSNTEREEL